MTLVFVLIVVTVMLMMLQKLVARIPPDAAEVPMPAGAGAPGGTPSLAKLRAAVQLLATLVGLVGGGYVVLYGDYSQEVQYWAAGLVGSIFGFWLR